MACTLCQLKRSRNHEPEVTAECGLQLSHTIGPHRKVSRFSMDHTCCNAADKAVNHGPFYTDSDEILVIHWLNSWFYRSTLIP